MSFALIFFAMVLKTWRVHKIILGGLKKVKIPFSHIFLEQSIIFQAKKT